MEENLVDRRFEELERKIADMEAMLASFVQNGTDVNYADGSILLMTDPIVSGGGEGGAQYGAFRYEKDAGENEDGTKYGLVTQCYYQFGRTVYHLQGEGSDGVHVSYGDTWYLVVDHHQPGNAEMSTTSGGTDKSTTTIPLFKINTDGDIVEDYRGMPIVPAWGSATS